MTGSGVSNALGPVAEFAWVDLDLIYVDSNYQRPVVSKVVEKILLAFQWRHFGALNLTAQPDGRFACTDGQNRFTAAKLHPMVTKVPAMISTAHGVRAEAETFLAINADRKAVTNVEKFWAGVAAEDSDYLWIKQVVERSGCKITPETGAAKPGEISAIAALERALKYSGEAALVSALSFIRETWPNEARAMRGTMISALARLYRANKDIDNQRMRKAMHRMSIPEMTAQAEGFRKLSGGTAETALARTVAELYNRGLSTNIIHYAA